MKCTQPFCLMCNNIRWKRLLFLVSGISGKPQQLCCRFRPFDLTWCRNSCIEHDKNRRTKCSWSGYTDCEWTAAKGVGSYLLLRWPLFSRLPTTYSASTISVLLGEVGEKTIPEKNQLASNRCRIFPLLVRAISINWVEWLTGHSCSE